MLNGLRRNPLLVGLWLLALAPAFYLTAWPLIANVWAGVAWRQVDCIVAPPMEGLERYQYVVDGVRYNAVRRDFWDDAAQSAERTRTERAFEGRKATCWVSGWRSTAAVLYLDAPQHLAKGIRGLVITAVLVGIAGFVTHRSRQRARAAQGAVQEPGA